MRYSNRKTQISLRIRTACVFSHMPSVPGNRGMYSSDCTDLQTGLDFGFADTLTTFAAQRILVQRLQKCSINCVQLHLKGNRNRNRYSSFSRHFYEEKQLLYRPVCFLERHNRANKGVYSIHKREYSGRRKFFPLRVDPH